MSGNKPPLAVITRICIALLIVALNAPLVFAEQQTNEIYVTYRTASKLVPVLEPLLGPNDRITPYRNKLMVKAPPSVQDEILNVLQQIDILPKNIRISVRYSSMDSRQSNPEASIVTVFHGSSLTSNIEVENINANRFSTVNDNVDQQIRVMEGEQGTLEIGQTYKDMNFVLIGPLAAMAQQQERSIGDVVYVVPQLVKDAIRLEIYTHNQRMRRNANGQIESIKASSVILAEPGVWTPLGSTQTTQAHNSNTQALSTQRMDDKRFLQIKAEVLD